MNRMISKLKNRKGFTLIELIVVLAVLAIIMAIAVPRFTGVQTQAKEDADAQTLLMIEKAAELYYAAEKPASATFTAADLVTNGYFDTVKFQSTANKSKTAADVEIAITDGKAKATIKAAD